MATQEPYFPLQVGRSINSIDLNIQADNEGDNISDKNRTYCELTGMYWAWKNLKNVDVVGLCHYRRYFDFHNQCDPVLPETSFSTAQFNQLDLSIPQDVIDNLKNGEAYVVKPRVYRESVLYQYCYAHISDDLKLLEHYIMTTQPENIKKAWFEYMRCNSQLRHYNMFIMTWHDFNEYCSWLFGVLSYVEQKVDISHYSSFQGRIFGFMAERLMNVWLLAHDFKLHEKALIWFNDWPGTGSRSYLKYYLTRLRSKLSIALVCGNYKNYRKSWS